MLSERGMSMEVYRDLLFSAGGGINCKDQMELQDNCATIAIGLGGTGIECLKNLKRQVYDRVQPDNPDGAIPTYNKIKFLAVDWDRWSVHEDGKINQLDPEKEFFDLGSLSSRGIRQFGRVLIIEKSEKFVEKVHRLILSAIEGTKSPDSDVNIHVFTGLGGGTGSGIFLDVCYIIKEELRRIAPKGNVNTFGYFVLPDANLSVPGITTDHNISKYIMSNSFAAMKELDYCMNFKNNGGSWNQQYQGFYIGPSSESPVDIAHLVSGEKRIENQFDNAINVISEFVMQFVVKNSMSINKYIMDFTNNMLNGKKSNYCWLEASSVTIPVKKFTTYVSSKLFSKLIKLQSNVPSNDDIDGFARAVGLEYNQLEKELLLGTSYEIPYSQFDYKLFLFMPSIRATCSLPSDILNPIEGYQEKMIDIIAKNMKSMIRPWNLDSRQIQEESRSKVWQVYEGLSQMLSDVSKGPFYAEAMLNGSAQNLCTYLRRQLSQIYEEREICEKREKFYFNEMAIAQEKFLYPGFFKKLLRKKLFEEFMKTIRNYYTNIGHIMVLEKMEEIVCAMIQQFEKLEKDCFSVYAEVMRDLKDTFEMNEVTLNEIEKPEQIKDNSFDMSLIEIKDLQENLDKMVKVRNLETEIKDFHFNLFTKRDIWKDKNQKEISKEVSDYLEERFKSSIYNLLLSMPQNEKQKYQQRLFKIIQEKVGTGVKSGYCSISSVGSILATIKSLNNPFGLEIIYGGKSYTISLMFCTFDKSITDYDWIKPCQYEYQNDVSTGKHIYEGTLKDSRDWRNLPDLIPYS